MAGLHCLGAEYCTSSSNIAFVILFPPPTSSSNIAFVIIFPPPTSAAATGFETTCYLGPPSNSRNSQNGDVRLNLYLYCLKFRCLCRLHNCIGAMFACTWVICLFICSFLQNGNHFFLLLFLHQVAQYWLVMMKPASRRSVINR